MDTLTHALSGALLARATESSSYNSGPRAGQLPRRLRMWVGFWAAAFPDSDFIVNFIDPLTYLTTHRGVTHSVIVLPLWAVGLALLFMLIARRRYSWTAFVGTCALGIGAHIAGDVITAFGTMIFAPFSAWRAQIPTTFIIDPYFTAIIGAGLVASAYWKRARLPAIAGLALLVSYVGFQALLHQRAVTVGEAFITANRIESAHVHAIPQPFSPFNWMVVVEQPKNYHLAYISLLRDQTLPPPPRDASWLQRVNASYRPVKDAQWQNVPRYGVAKTDAELAETTWSSEVLARYRGFTLFPAVYRVDREGARVCVWFNDLRFALVGRDMPFRYGACRENAAAPWKVFRLNSDDHGGDILEMIPD